MEGFDNFLATLHFSHQSEITKHETMDGISVFALEAVLSGILDLSWKNAYQDLVWFGDIYRFLNGSLEAPSASLIQKSLSYKIICGIL